MPINPGGSPRKTIAKLLNFLLSNCSWTNGELTYKFKQQFNMIAKSNTTHKARVATEGADQAEMKEWRSS